MTALWYATRGSGAVALILLTLGIVVGIVGSLRWRSSRWPAFAVTLAHRNVTLLSLSFVVVHVLTTVADGYAPVGLKDAVIPFASAYRPLWVGLGAVAFDLVLALVVTSLILRKRLGYRRWRAIHWLAYASWPVALVHGFGAGSDARASWLVAVAVACVLAVGAAVAVRLARSPLEPRVRLGGGAGIFVAALLLLVWYDGGPGHTGWARRAGTPASLLHASAASTRGAAPAARELAHRFSGRLHGRLARSSDASGDVGIAFTANVSGRVPAVLHLTLWGQALVGGGVSLTQSSVTFDPVGTGRAYAGRVTALDGSELVASLSDSSGAPLRLGIVLHLQPNSPAFTGSLRGLRAA